MDSTMFPLGQLRDKWPGFLQLKQEPEAYNSDFSLSLRRGVDLSR